MDIITSTKNQRIKDIKKLSQRKFRTETGLCFVDGIQPVLRALDNDLEVETLVVAPTLLKSDVALERLKEEENKGTPCLYVSDDVYDHISDRDNPVGLAAVIRQRWQRLEQLPEEKQSIYAALHDVKNPGNLGTIIRTVDAFGGDGVILLGQTADPYDPACIKASMGTAFNVPLVKLDNPDAFLVWSRSRGIKIVTTSARAPQTLSNTHIPFPAAVLFGSEAQGLPDTLLHAGDIQVGIPMLGQASSLNLAVAVGIMLYEARNKNQKR